jgi:hypothetical protein
MLSRKGLFAGSLGGRRTSVQFGTNIGLDAEARWRIGGSSDVRRPECKAVQRRRMTNWTLNTLETTGTAKLTRTGDATDVAA